MLKPLRENSVFHTVFKIWFPRIPLVRDLHCCWWFKNKTRDKTTSAVGLLPTVLILKSWALNSYIMYYYMHSECMFSFEHLGITCEFSNLLCSRIYVWEVLTLEFSDEVSRTLFYNSLQKPSFFTIILQKGLVFMTHVPSCTASWLVQEITT